MINKFNSVFDSLTSASGKDVAVEGSPMHLPEGYRNTKDGFFYVNSIDTPQLMHSPIVPVSKGISADRKSNPRLRLIAKNPFGTLVDIIVDMSVLEERGAVSFFAPHGISVCSGKAKLLETFLKRCMLLDIPTTLVATGNGFVEGQFAFVHGNYNYYSELVGGFSAIELHSPDNIPKSLRKEGCFKEWQAGIKKYAHGSPQVFALVAAFSSYFLSFMQKECFIVHFYGSSTTGKTLLLQLAASVHGYGGEPGDAKGSIIGRWYTTDNGIEAHLVSHAGTVLLLDELGAYRGRDLGGVIYNIAAATPKGRMNKDLSLNKGTSWHGCALSSGELSVSSKMAENKAQLTEGQAHRAISIRVRPEDAGRDGETVHEIRARADALKILLTEHSGVAIHELLTELVNPENFDEPLTNDSLRSYLSDLISEVEEDLSKDLAEKGFQLTSAQNRALHRLAYISAMGQFVASDGSIHILPLTCDAIYNAVLEMTVRWLEDDQNRYSPAKRVLCEIYAQLQQKGHNNFSDGLEDYLPSPFWGFDRQNKFQVLDSVFNGWCERFNVRSYEVAQILERAGYLAKEGPGHYKKRIQVAGKKFNIFEINKNFLSADLDIEF